MSRKSVLLVDSDQDVLDVMKRMLKKIGFSVVCVTSGSDAMAAFDKESFDVVISDYYLVDMTGVHLVRSLKGTRTNIQVLLMAGFIDPTIRELIRSENLPFIAKPFLKHELRDALRALLSANQ